MSVKNINSIFQPIGDKSIQNEVQKFNPNFPHTLIIINCVNETAIPVTVR